MNKLIEEWKKGANLLKEINEYLGQNWNLKDHAKTQIDLIIKNRPNKDLTAEEQMNEEQKEIFEYIKKVALTGQL